MKLKLARACQRDRPLLLQIKPPLSPVRLYTSDSRDALTGLNLRSSIEQSELLRNFPIIERQPQMAQQDSNASLAVSKPKQALTGPSCNVLFSQLKELLDTAEAKSIGYDDLQLSLQNEKRSVDQLRRALETQQRQIDSFVTQDVLVSQLTSQLAAQSKTIEQMEARVQQQGSSTTLLRRKPQLSSKSLGTSAKGFKSLSLKAVVSSKN